MRRELRNNGVIPLKGTFNVHSKQRLSIYLSMGVTLDIPVKATSESIASNESGQITFCGKSDIHPDNHHFFTTTDGLL